MPRSIEFETELTGGKTLELPEIASGDLDSEDAAWRKRAYELFLADDSEKDSTFDRHVSAV
jgi:hypothetical protein